MAFVTFFPSLKIRGKSDHKVLLSTYRPAVFVDFLFVCVQNISSYTF